MFRERRDAEGFLNGIVTRVFRLPSFPFFTTMFLFYSFDLSFSSHTLRFPCSSSISFFLHLALPLSVSMSVSIFLSLLREQPRLRNVCVAFVADHTSRRYPNGYSTLYWQGRQRPHPFSILGCFYERGASEKIFAYFLASIFEGFDASFVSLQ